MQFPLPSHPFQAQRRRLLLALPIASISGGVWAATPEALAPGQSAPDFDLPGQNDRRTRLSDLAGKVVYLDFWASWCGPCRQSFPWMNALHADWRQRGLHILAVNVDARRADAMRFLADNPPTFALAFDAAGATPRAYGVRAMPTSFIIDRKGVIAAVHAGFTESRGAAMRREIETILGAG